MVFKDELIEKLIDVEVKLISISFKTSDELGERAVKSALTNFYFYLCKAKGVDATLTIPSLNVEYRSFVISFAKAIPEKLLAKAMPVILGVR